jgi:hypothetical protein
VLIYVPFPTFSAFSFAFSFFLRTFALDYGVNPPWSTAALAPAVRLTSWEKEEKRMLRLVH